MRAAYPGDDRVAIFHEGGSNMAINLTGYIAEKSNSPTTITM